MSDPSKLAPVTQRWQPAHPLVLNASPLQARPLRPGEVIEDDYPEYLEETRGYAWDAWDLLDDEATRRHDERLHAGAEALEARDAGDDLEQWATIRALTRLGEEARALAMLDALLAGERAHLALNYDELYAEAVERALRVGADAAALLERWRASSPEHDLTLWHILHALASDDAQSAATGLGHACARGDAEELCDLGDALARHGYGEYAREAWERAEVAAREAGMTAVLVDLALRLTPR